MLVMSKSFLVMLLAGVSDAWNQGRFPAAELITPVMKTKSNDHQPDRRRFLENAAVVLGVGAVPCLKRDLARAAMTESNKIFTAGQPIETDFAKERFKLARRDLQYLLDNYDEICQGGGDNVRRYLGTVGTTSGLFGIQKVLKALQDEADDFIAYTEDMNEFNSFLAGAEGAAYSAIFVVTSSSSTPPQKYYDDAKRNALKMRYHLDNMAKELKL